jgi:(2Fe-2S) ferredoxin
MARRKNYLFVCVNQRADGAPNGSCAARGGAEVHAALKERLKERGLSGAIARPCTSSCLDVCWVGPVILVEPGGTFYGRVRLEDVEEIVDALEQGKVVERLVVKEDELLEPREQRMRLEAEK